MDNALTLTRTRNFLRKPLVGLLLRVVVSVLLFAYLIRISALSEVTRTFGNLEPAYVLAFFVLYCLSVVVQSWRWQLLLRAWGLARPFGSLFRSLMAGLFLNNFLPGSLGGDVYRLYAGGRATGRVESVAATIFYERLLSYGSLVTLGLLVLAARANPAVDWLFWLLLGGVWLALAGILTVSVWPRFAVWLEWLLGRLPLAGALPLMKWVQSFRFRVREPGRLAAIVVLSFVIQLGDIAAFRLVAGALQLPVRLSDLLLFVPLLYLVILLPVSVNGIGVRESVFVVFAASWGITSADAVAFSLTVFVLNLAGSLPGGLLYWFDRSTPEHAA